MPLQVDHAVPVRTVDVRGNVIGTDTGKAAPIKHVDSVGRALQEDVARVAEQAVATHPEFGQEAGKPEDAEAKPTEADIRKAYLEAQKARRRAQDLEKKARDGLTRAEAFDKAKALAENGEDPTEILKAAGLNPVKYYQDLTKYALSDRGKTVEDPVQKELREHRERLDKYAKDLEVQAKTISDKEEVAAHNQVITDKVIPLLRDNSEKYECLLTEYGDKAAVEVYKTVWEIYQKTGKARSFTEVADEMEQYWGETIDKGIQAAAKLKKFQNRFAQNGNGISQQFDRTETPKRSVTLSNRPSASASAPTASPVRKWVMTRDERVAEILKRFPD